MATKAPEIISVDIRDDILEVGVREFGTVPSFVDDLEHGGMKPKLDDKNKQILGDREVVLTVPIAAMADMTAEESEQYLLKLAIEALAPKPPTPNRFASLLGKKLS
jgi:hypothetical protein